MKICFICRGFTPENYHLQPWRYVYEIASGIAKIGHNVIIITDCYENSSLFCSDKTFDIFTIKKFRIIPFFSNKKISDQLNTLNPDIIILSTGFTSVSTYRIIRQIEIPIICLWMGSRYSLKDILNLGTTELTRNFSSLYLFLINSIIPPIILTRFLNMKNIKKIIAINDENRLMLIKYGVQSSKIVTISPGIDDFDLELPDPTNVQNLRLSLNLTTNDFVLLYFGSPLSLRGTDILIKALKKLEKKEGIKLIFLSRNKENSLNLEEKFLKKLIKKYDINNISLLSGFVDKNKIKEFISLSDLVVLPFKIVQADMPLSILEAMALGSLVVSTKTDGIPGLLMEKRGYLVQPNDVKDLVSAIEKLYSNSYLRDNIKKNARNYMIHYPRWDDIIKKFWYEINQIQKSSIIVIK